MCIVEVCCTLSSGSTGGYNWTARPEQHVKAADGPYGMWHRSFHARFSSRGSQDFETCFHVGMKAPVDSLLTSSLCSNVSGSSLCIVYRLRRIRHDCALQDGCSFLTYVSMCRNVNFCPASLSGAWFVGWMMSTLPSRHTQAIVRTQRRARWKKWPLHSMHVC